MDTLHLETDATSISTAAELLQRGQLVAFPTETVYGLGAALALPEAIQEIYRVKGRPADNPVIIHCHSLEQVKSLLPVAVRSEILERLEKLAAQHWPGPLTLILPRGKQVTDVVAAGLPTMAVRVPHHPVALALIKETGSPIAAPSANVSGKPSPTLASHVVDDLEGKIAAIIDGGPATIGIESTVINITTPQPVILRPGYISQAELENTLQEAVSFPSIHDDPGSPAVAPGMKYRHYAPEAKIIIFDDWSDVPASDQKTLYLSNLPTPSSAVVHPLNTGTVFAEFRAADDAGYEKIVIVLDETTQQNAGLMNRIEKAAAG